MPQPPIPPTPQGPRATNRGIPLYSQFKGGESDTVREIPPEWRAALDILVIETPVPIDSTVVDLTSGVLAIKREQKLTSEATLRSTATDTELPATLLEYDTDRNKEIVTRTRNFRFIDDLPSIAVPGPLRDVKTRNFGNKHFEETIEDTASLFVHAVYEEEIPNLIPPEFRALIPTLTYEFTEIGIASAPTLGIGELKVKEEQLDVFVKRETHVSQDTPSLPATLINFETTEEFGGGILAKVITLDDDPMVPDTGLLVAGSESVTLGGGLFLKTSKILNDTVWPVQFNSNFDKEMQVFVSELEQVVAPTVLPTSGPYFVDRVKSIDKWRSKRTRLVKQPTAISEATALQSSVFGPYQFPGLVVPVLNGVYVKRAIARLVEHRVKTWWVRKATKPTTGPPGSGADVIFNETITDTCLVNALNDVTKLDYAHDVLHNAFTINGIFFPATTPSASEYKFGVPTGGTFTTRVLVPGGGSGYVVGDLVSFGGLTNRVTGTLSGAISSSDPHNYTIPNAEPVSVVVSSSGSLSGGHGTGGTGEIWTITWRIAVAGSAWIGNLKVIGASVEQTDIPLLWKIETKSVVMR